MTNRTFILAVALALVACCAGMAYLALDPSLSALEPAANVYAGTMQSLNRSGPIGQIGADIVAYTIAGIVFALVVMAFNGFYQRMKGR